MSDQSNPRWTFEDSGRSEVSRLLLPLAEKYCNEELTLDEAAELNTLLLDCPQRQSWFIEYVGVHAALQCRFAAADAAPGAGQVCLPEGRAGGFRHLANLVYGPASRRWALAVSLLLLILVPVSITGVARHLLRPEVQEYGYVARLTGFNEMVTEPGKSWQRDAPLARGHFKLVSGIAEVTFESGATAIVEGPADFELTDECRALLHRGRVVVRVPPQAEGFEIETPQASLVDLGTEFGVDVSQAAAHVQVYDGAVVAKLKYTESAEETRLTAGDALRIDQSQEARTRPRSRRVEFLPDRFVRYLPGQGLENPKSKPSNQPAHELVRILPKPGPVTIDGELSDWDLNGRFRSQCDPPFAAYRLEGAMMYDRDGLYVAALVSDPFPMQSRLAPQDNRVFDGGCLQIRLSTDRQMGWPVRGQGRGTETIRKLVEEDYNDKLSHLTLWYDQPQGTACLKVEHGMDLHDRKFHPPGYQGAFRKHPDRQGYTAEYFVPWSLLNAADDPPRAGDTLGCTWLVHWSGPNGLNWKGQLVDVVNPDETGWNFQNAATWGQAIYE